MDTINLDHNATTPLLPEVAEAVERAFRAGYANSASQHALGRRAHAVVEEARETIAALLGADLSRQSGDQLVFTSGGSEANHLAIFGAVADQPPARIAVSAIEHPSVLGPAKALAAHGWQVDWLGADRNGVVGPSVDDALDRSGEADPADESGPRRLALVCLMLANHETGALQPVAQLAESCRNAGVPLHTDAVQAVGKLPVDFRRLGATTLSFAAHKFHGPIGIGGLLIRGGAALRPQMHGGFQQQGLRPGTEPVPLIVGMQAALELFHREAAARTAHLATLRDRFEAAVADRFPEAVVHARHAPRLPQTSNIALVGRDRRQLMMALDLAGVTCSTGSACASGSSEPSHVLVAMHCEPEVVHGSLRFSFGAENRLDEVDEAVRRLTAILRPFAERSA